jgi:hypothetical protein
MAPAFRENKLVIALAVLHGNPNSSPSTVWMGGESWIPLTQFDAALRTIVASTHDIITCRNGVLDNAGRAPGVIQQALYDAGLLVPPGGEP